MNQTQDRLNEYWAGRAEAYHQYHTDSERAKEDWDAWSKILKRFIPEDAVRVLDLGTGDGYMAHIAATLGFEVVGADACEAMLDEARDEAELRQERGLNAPHFVEADATKLPPSLWNFNVITSRYFLWTLRDPQEAIAGWKEALVPGGTVIAIDANWFVDGVDKSVQVESSNGPDSFVLTYDDAMLDELPLSRATSSAEYVEVFKQAGLVDVEAFELPEITELDKKFGTAPGHKSRPNFVVVGRTPAQ